MNLYMIFDYVDDTNLLNKLEACDIEDAASN